LANYFILNFNIIINRILNKLRWTLTLTLSPNLKISPIKRIIPSLSLFKHDSKSINKLYKSGKIKCKKINHKPIREILMLNISHNKLTLIQALAALMYQPQEAAHMTLWQIYKSTWKWGTIFEILPIYFLNTLIKSKLTFIHSNWFLKFWYFSYKLAFFNFLIR